jgi:hypothetical protein
MEAILALSKGDRYSTINMKKLSKESWQPSQDSGSSHIQVWSIFTTNGKTGQAVLWSVS